MTEVVKSINSFLWGPPMMILLVGFGVVSTRTGISAVQKTWIRAQGDIWKDFFQKG